MHELPDLNGIDNEISWLELEMNILGVDFASFTVGLLNEPELKEKRRSWVDKKIRRCGSTMEDTY